MGGVWRWAALTVLGPGIRAIALCVLACALPAAAVDSLVVGAGEGRYGWRSFADWGSVDRVTVTYDSVFKWDVTPNMNLATGALQRGGSFIQVRFTAAVFGDATRSEVRAVDRRLVDGQSEYAYQVAAEGDVDPVSAGGSLVVRLREEDRTRAVLVRAQAAPCFFTPNGDGINEVCHISYDLLNLTRETAITIAIHDLTGNRVRWLYKGADGQGHYSHAWDGRDGTERLVCPGVYVFRICLEADGGDGVHQGSVGVAY